MSILVDKDIAKCLNSDPKRLADGVRADDHTSKDSSIQASSLDLTIGEIYTPGAENYDLGGAKLPRKERTLAQGETAVIRTKETLHLDTKLAGIAFPPSNVSLKGLLTTNPGHIDPGYSGPLHLTVINMGRAPYSLKAGDRIMRVLFIKLDDEPDAPYNVRVTETTSPISWELLNRLSVDFLDIKTRAEKIAEGAVRSAQISAFLIPIAVAIVAGAATSLGSYFLERNTELQELKTKVSVIDTKLDQHAMDGRIQKLEDDVARLKASQPAGPARQ